MGIRKKPRPLAAMRTPEEIRIELMEVKNLYDAGKLSLRECYRMTVQLLREAKDYEKAYQREKGAKP